MSRAGHDGALGLLWVAETSGVARLGLGQPLRVGSRAVGGRPWGSSGSEAEILDVRGVRRTVSGPACGVEGRKAFEPREADECTWALDCGCRAGIRG
ncbi:hypothetical protein NDU88_005431 [Pleurodeles waltl]|uniref:Uncharacterized protein n=1 Tax=Pleurodeles waltl TaxID=8319 RepID=A0AAV7WX03_PLEWA|nr:hypothetical protein NDU88_005431 [Pleurodeles waltl]